MSRCRPSWSASSARWRTRLPLVDVAFALVVLLVASVAAVGIAALVMLARLIGLPTPRSEQ